MGWKSAPPTCALRRRPIRIVCSRCCLTGPAASLILVAARARRRKSCWPSVTRSIPSCPAPFWPAAAARMRLQRASMNACSRISPPPRPASTSACSPKVSSISHWIRACRNASRCWRRGARSSWPIASARPNIPATGCWLRLVGGTASPPSAKRSPPSLSTSSARRMSPCPPPRRSRSSKGCSTSSAMA